MTMKRSKLFYWISTSILFIWFGLMSLVFFGSEEQKAGMTHYGYPPYFGPMVSVFGIIGSTALLFPFVPARLKEWAYFGLALNIIGATVSGWAVDGFGMHLLFPLFFFIPLVVSYLGHHKMETEKPSAV